jgi:hypothetical protein
MSKESSNAVTPSYPRTPVERLTHQALSVTEFIVVRRQTRQDGSVQGPESPTKELIRSGLRRWVSADGSTELLYQPFAGNQESVEDVPRAGFRLALGLPTEPLESGPILAPHGLAAVIDIDTQEDGVTAIASTTGLPPLFCCLSPECAIVASSIGLIRRHSRVTWEWDPQALLDLVEIGFPLGSATLFKKVRLLRPGCRLILGRTGAELRETWELQDNVAPSWQEFLDAQERCFRTAIANLPPAGTILSLSAGLDTRTIFAALLELGHPFVCCTLSGPTESLEASIARALCRQCGVEHHTVRLGDRYRESLPDLVLEATLRTGGIASLEQAHEVYFHRELSALGSWRLTGLYGNQVLREGMERVALRGADTRILNREIHSLAGRRQRQHWLKGTGPVSELEAYRRRIQEEALFSSIASFGIGSSFVPQASPYADRRMIETSARSPDSRRMRTFSANAARVRDLRHRFVGESIERSFQRRLLAKLTGPIGTMPLNWGWLPRGGWRLDTAIGGMAALTDAFIHKALAGNAYGARFAGFLGVKGRHEYVFSQELARTRLSVFVADTLTDPRAVDNGLFDRKFLRRILDQWTKGVDKVFPALAAALDIALADASFVRRPGCTEVKRVTPADHIVTL